MAQSNTKKKQTHLVILNNRADDARTVGGRRNKQLHNCHAFCRVVRLVTNKQIDWRAIIIDLKVSNYKSNQQSISNLASMVDKVVCDVEERFSWIADAQKTAIDCLYICPCALNWLDASAAATIAAKHILIA